MGGRDLMAGVATMTSREIAVLTGKNHADVMRDIRKMLSDLEKDQSNFADIFFDSYNRSQPCFKLPHDETICLMTGYDAKARMAVILRWKELEAQAAVALPDFSNPAAAARAWADEVESKQALQLQVDAAKPALAFVDNYVIRSTGSQSFRAVAKLIGAKENAFRKFLGEEKIMYSLGGAWHTYAQHLDAGRFEVRTGTTADGVETKGHAFSQTLFTPKGVTWIAGEWAKHQIANRDGSMP